MKKKAYDVIQASEAHHSESFDMRYAARVSEGSVLSRILKERNIRAKRTLIFVS